MEFGIGMNWDRLGCSRGFDVPVLFLDLPPFASTPSLLSHSMKSRCMIRDSRMNADEYAKLCTLFAGYGIDHSKVGFYDNPSFIRQESRDPSILEKFAQVVEGRPYPDEYLSRARREIPVITRLVWGSWLRRATTRTCSLRSCRRRVARTSRRTLVESIIRYHTAMRELTNRRGIRDDVTLSALTSRARSLAIHHRGPSLPASLCPNHL